MPTSTHFTTTFINENHIQVVQEVNSGADAYGNVRREAKFGSCALGVICNGKES